MTPQAQQIVDRFKPYVSDAGITYAEMLETERLCSIKASIVAVEFALQHSYWTEDYRLLSILSELKNELK